MSAVTVELDAEQMQRLERVCRSTGVEASVALADALVVYESSLSEDYRQHFTPEQIADIEAGIEDARNGRTTDHDDVARRLEAKFGR